MNPEILVNICRQNFGPTISSWKISWYQGKNVFISVNESWSFISKSWFGCLLKISIWILAPSIVRNRDWHNQKEASCAGRFDEFWIVYPKGPEKTIVNSIRQVTGDCFAMYVYAIMRQRLIIFLRWPREKEMTKPTPSYYCPSPPLLVISFQGRQPERE